MALFKGLAKVFVATALVEYGTHCNAVWLRVQRAKAPLTPGPSPAVGRGEGINSSHAADPLVVEQHTIRTALRKRGELNAGYELQKLILSILILASSFSMVEVAGKAAPPGETKRVRWASAPAVRQNSYRVQRMKDNLTIDADWNKSVWKNVPPMTLEYYMGEEPAHQPKVQARTAYDDHFLYVIWKVDDKYVLAKRTKHQQDVWRDSCVELFFTPGGDPDQRGYFNLETNCAGV